MHPLREVGRDADVEGAVSSACKDVDVCRHTSASNPLVIPAKAGPQEQGTWKVERPVFASLSGSVFLGPDVRRDTTLQADFLSRFAPMRSLRAFRRMKPAASRWL
jgi:hypothetical protein